jgi:hypothetical protein
MSIMASSSKSMFQVTASCDGRDLGRFNTKTGGDITSDITGRWTADGWEVTAGRPMIGDITFGRGFNKERDHELIRWLDTKVGGGRLVLNVQPLDEEGNVWGKPRTGTGRLKESHHGDIDSSSNEPQDWELVGTMETWV